MGAYISHQVEETVLFLFCVVIELFLSLRMNHAGSLKAVLVTTSASTPEKCQNFPSYKHFSCRK